MSESKGIDTKLRKSYFLKYGTNISKSEICDLIEKKWDISVVEHDSAYFGEYFAYSGLYADKISITDNYNVVLQEWLDEENKQYCTLINISITNGKNVDKLSKYKFMKSVFNQLNVVSIISDKCIEEE